MTTTIKKNKEIIMHLMIHSKTITIVLIGRDILIESGVTSNKKKTCQWPLSSELHSKHHVVTRKVAAKEPPPKHHPLQLTKNLAPWKIDSVLYFLNAEFFSGSVGCCCYCWLSCLHSPLLDASQECIQINVHCILHRIWTTD